MNLVKQVVNGDPPDQKKDVSLQPEKAQGCHWDSNSVQPLQKLQQQLLKLHIGLPVMLAFRPKKWKQVYPPKDVCRGSRGSCSGQSPSWRQPQPSATGEPPRGTPCAAMVCSHQRSASYTPTWCVTCASWPSVILMPWHLGASLAGQRLCLPELPVSTDSKCLAWEGGLHTQTDRSRAHTPQGQRKTNLEDSCYQTSSLTTRQGAIGIRTRRSMGHNRPKSSADIRQQSMAVQWRKDSLWNHWTSVCKITNDPRHRLYTKTNSKWTIDLNISAKQQNFLKNI